jgi:Flp pilus assembly protein TadG
MKRLPFIGRRNRGNTIVEFALTLPIFILLVIGIVEFGYYFFVQHTLQYATREGMRLALVGRQLVVGGATLSPEASIIKTIQDNVAIAVKPAAVNIYIYPVTSSYQDPSNWQSYSTATPGGNPTAGNPGDYMRVRSTYVHKFFTPLIGTFFTGGSIVIRAEGTYRNELFTAVGS